MDEFKTVVKIAKEINKAGGRCFFVGGFVRDKILGLDNKDIDIEIFNISVAKTLNILEEFGEIDIVGKSFGVLKIKGLDIDFAFPRTESKSGNKHTDFEVNVNPFLSFKDAAKRRDFTMNSIMQDVLTSEFIDSFNGIQDIKDKVIRVVDQDTFKDDSLRVLRAAQFSSRLGFDVDNSVFEAAKNMDFTLLSKERIMGELTKGLLGNKPSNMMRVLEKSGVLSQILPELQAMVDSEQDSKAHAEGDVFEHTMMVVDEAVKFKDQAKNIEVLMFAALFHDIGKPNTAKVIDGKIRNFDHETVGAEIAKTVLDRLTTDRKFKREVCLLVKNHMKMHNVLFMRTVKLRRLMFSVNMNDLFLLNAADENGRITTFEVDDDFSEKFLRINGLSNGGFGVINREVLGRDLISLGMKPGKEMGLMLGDALELQMQGMSKSRILELMKRKIKNMEEV